MKGNINEGGFLAIHRGKKMKKQVCPDKPTDYCGDWCPRFGEPEPEIDGSPNQYGEFSTEPTGNIDLQICQDRILTFSEFTDERVK